VNCFVLLFAIGISLAVGVCLASRPALKSSKTDLQGSLKEAGHGVARGHGRAQSSLVIVQMALTLVLLVGAGLFVPHDPSFVGG